MKEHESILHGEHIWISSSMSLHMASSDPCDQRVLEEKVGIARLALAELTCSQLLSHTSLFCTANARLTSFCHRTQPVWIPYGKAAVRQAHISRVLYRKSGPVRLSSVTCYHSYEVFCMLNKSWASCSLQCSISSHALPFTAFSSSTVITFPVVK